MLGQASNPNEPGKAGLFYGSSFPPNGGGPPPANDRITQAGDQRITMAGDKRVTS